MTATFGSSDFSPPLLKNPRKRDNSSRMGYEVERFVGVVDEELFCPICGLVLDSPLQIKDCEHCFCGSCIEEWLKHQRVCPVDRTPVPPSCEGSSLSSALGPAPRILRNLLSRLRIKCENEVFGCQTVTHLEGLQLHLNQCEYNPRRPVECDRGCGSVVPLDELTQHNCIKELREKIMSQSSVMKTLSDQVSILQQELSDQRREVTILKELIRSSASSSGSNSLRQTLSILAPPPPLSSPSSVSSSQSNYPDEVERAIQTSQWLSLLRPARIRHWGGIISTPDSILQSIIRQALSSSGCPQYLLVELMANAHERRWPPGLSVLETRQLNRSRYEQYVTKQVPGKQAVVIMASENEHMGDNMIVSPGMVIIFAHGVD